MLPLLLFFAKMLIVSALLFGYYFLFLRNNRFHQWNRYYLLATAALALLIPFFNIPLHWQDSPTAAQPLLRSIDIISINQLSLPPARSEITLLELLSTAIYTIVSLFLLLYLLHALWHIRQLRRRYPKENIGDIGFYNTAEPAAPFSFFRSVFWHHSLALNSDKGQQVFRHELAHVREKHSIDKLCIEIITALFWWNPFFHLLKRELKLVHEFIADRYATSGRDALEYAELLLQHAMSSRNPPLTHPFFHQQLKRRIMMITVGSNPRYVYLRKVMVLPLLTLLFMALAFTIRNNRNHTPVPQQAGTALADTTKPRQLIEIREEDKAIVRDDNYFPEGGLLVLDGKMYRGQAAKDKLAALNPTDIAQVNVRSKDPKAIVQYGEAARNGVVEVETKQYQKSEAPRIKSVTLTNDNGETLVVTEREIAATEKESGLFQEGRIFVIDGKIYTFGEARSLFAKLQPTQIAEVNILNSKQATALYGEQARNGAAIIKLKQQVEVVEERVAPGAQISVSASAEPLLIIDDKIIGNTDRKKIETMLRAANIHSVHVLKADAAEKMYGEKGKNGAIEVTTKEKAMEIRRNAPLPSFKFFTPLNQQKQDSC